MPPTNPSAVITDLAFDRHGGPDGPALLFLHGLSGARTSWDPVWPAFPERDIYALDHRGHGESPRAAAPDSYTVEDYTADAAAFLEREVGRPAAVVGHSLGGIVAAHLGATRPELVTCLFLEDPPLYLGDREAWETTIFAQFFPMARDAFRGFRDAGFSEEQVYDVIRNLPDASGGGSMGEVNGEEATRRQAQTWHRFDPEAYTAAIDGTLFAAYDPTAALPFPVHLLRAERDLGAAFLPEHEAPFLDAQPEATVELVEGASHLIHDDRLDWFISRLREFLDGIEHR